VTARVLVVEDQPDLGALLVEALAQEAFEARLVGDGREVLPMIRRWGPDVVLLDLMLPGLDGFEVLRQVRATDEQLPVIILSARGEEADRIRGIRLDADQYLTKPFSLAELVERIHALLRRTARGRQAPSSVHRFGDLVIDVAARTVHRAGEPVGLSPKAFELLLALVRREGAVASRAALLREVWGYQALVMSRTVDSHVAELRRKIEDDPAEPRHVVTVYKAGYRFVP
jgi:DNA-binding response OmpR family regulator